jgi:hypothetical protein
VQPDSGGGGGSGVPIVAQESDLPAASGSGDLYYVVEGGLVVVDTMIGTNPLWLPVEALRQSDGTYYSAAWGQNAAGDPAKVFPGDVLTVGAGRWTFGGAGIDPNDALGVAVNGYGYIDLVGTASRVLIVQKLVALPGPSVAESGIMGGSTVGGTARYINSRIDDAGEITHGLYQTITSQGVFLGEADKTFWTLVDMNSAGAAIRSWSMGAGASLGGTALSTRANMGITGAYFQMMSVNPAGTGVKTVWAHAGLIELT